MNNKEEIWKNFFIKKRQKPKLFQNLSEESLQTILKNSIVQQYEEGRTLVQQGDTPEYIYLIIEGQVRTLRSNTDGSETTIRMLLPEDICMEAVVFMGGTSPISVQTISNVQLMLIPQKFVKKFILQDAQFANNLLQITTHHYKNALHQIDAMSIKSPVQRVGYYLLQQHIEQNQDSLEFKLPFKKSTIANHLGITPETFSRALNKIKSMGIEIDGETIRMKNYFSLCQFCDLDISQHCTSTKKDECSFCPINDDRF